jgi:molecular chaperone GrpE
MKKQHSEKEQDKKTSQQCDDTQEGATNTPEQDTMSDEAGATTDNMSLEPTLEEQIAVWRDKYMRLQAEFDNFRKRTIKENMELVEPGSEGAWKAILPVLDDMDRALAASAKSDDIVA